MDDDHDHLLFCTLIFQRRGYDVLCSNGCSPTELLQMLADFSPDLVFVDHQMRGISGAEAIQTIKSMPKYSLIPAVYFSAVENLELFAKEAGADTHLKKPFTIQRLLDVTQGLIP